MGVTQPRRHGFVGFGRGQRKCPAERFSRTAAAVIVEGLLRSLTVHAPFGTRARWKEAALAV